VRVKTRTDRLLVRASRSPAYRLLPTRTAAQRYPPGHVRFKFPKETLLEKKERWRSRLGNWIKRPSSALSSRITASARASCSGCELGVLLAPPDLLLLAPPDLRKQSAAGEQPGNAGLTWTAGLAGRPRRTESLAREPQGALPGNPSARFSCSMMMTARGDDPGIPDP